jgi:hypothetical protein
MKWGKNQQELHMGPPPLLHSSALVARLSPSCFPAAGSWEFLCWGDVDNFALFLLGACDSVVDTE